jgi:tRNA U38,U39,U40 pseudouridine synthase TruA
MYLARAVVLNLRTGETSSSLPDQQHADRDALAIAVEFVGSRFVRNMVRVLVATALRECLQQQQREKEVDPQILVKYCQISDR